MSRVVCPSCGNTDVSWIYDDTDYAQYICPECKQVFCYPPKTLFEHIIKSPEVLAESVVYTYEMAIGGSMFRVYWTSPFVENFYVSKEEAIAATLEKLNSIINYVKENTK